MVPVLLSFIPFALLFLYVIPTSRSKILGILYLMLILLFIWGIGGFVFSGNPSSNEKFVFYAFYMFILGVHIPLLIKLHQTDVKRHTVKSARQILGKDIQHLTEDELHYRLKH